MHTMAGTDRFVAVGGLQLHYVEWGSPTNPPLIMLHGVGSLAHIWDFIAPAFVSTYHVLSLDWRGHGDSDRSSDSVYSYDLYVGDLEGLVSNLGLTDLTLVGHSLGGYVALYYASRNRDSVRAVVAADVRTSISPEEVQQLRSISVRPHKEIDSQEEIILRFGQSLSPIRAPGEALKSIGQHAIRQSSPGKWIYKFDRKVMAISEVSPWHFLPAVKAPTLIIRGQESSMMPHDGALEMARMVANGRFAEIEAAYHHLFLDHPDEFIEVVGSFLDQSDTV